MRFGLRVPPCAPISQVAAFVAQLEAAGYDTAWLPDSQLLWRDAYMALAAAAMSTSRIRLGTAVTNVRTRHPSVIASCVRTIREVAGGRMVLGLGAGASSVRPLGLPLASATEIEAAVTQIRTLCRGDVVDLGVRRVRMRDPGGACPILMAATGPRRLELAGRIADGVIVHSGTTPERLEGALAAVTRGAVSAGRSLADLETVVTAATLVTDDPERDARLLKPICLTVAQDGGSAALRAAGVEVADAPPSASAPASEVYPDAKHAEDWLLAVSAADAVMTDDAARRFASQFCFFGTPQQIASQVRDLGDLGVTEVLFQDLSSYELPADLAAALAPLGGALAGERPAGGALAR